MTDRRAADRRQRITPSPSERRHGDRRTYKSGCHCTPCRAAEADYRAQLRLRHAHGADVLGALVDADLTWQLLRLLKPDYFGAGRLALALGLQTAQLQFSHRRVRLSTQRRVEAEVRRVS